MGFFSMNEHSNLYANIDFPVLEGYNTSAAANMIIVEGYQNDLALFTAAVENDLTEMSMINNGSDITAVQEASISGMWEAIKAFFVKLGAKIKALFTAFMAKIESFITKDTKVYVKKYEKALNNKDFKDMKCKYAEPKEFDFVINDRFDFIHTTYEDKIDEMKDRNDLLEEEYEAWSNNKASNKKEYEEWLHEQMYEDEEEKDNWDAGSIRQIAARLSSSSKTIKDAKSANDKILSGIAKIIKEIDNEAKRVNNLYKDNKTDDAKGKNKSFNMTLDGKKITNDYKGEVNYKISNAQKDIQEARMMASVYQEVCTTACNAFIKELKFDMIQMKRVFTKAVAYKTIKTESVLNMIEDCVYEDAMEFFDREVSVA